MTQPTKTKKAKHPVKDIPSEGDLPEDRELPVQSETLRRQLEQHNSKSPVLSGGDMDAAWEEADSDGDETVGGTAATPGQDVVEELGRAVGITYNDDEPLNTEDKLLRRDRNRWELNPDSAEDDDEVPITWDQEEDDFDLEDEAEDEEGL